MTALMTQHQGTRQLNTSSKRKDSFAHLGSKLSFDRIPELLMKNVARYPESSTDYKTEQTEQMTKQNQY